MRMKKLLIFSFIFTLVTLFTSNLVFAGSVDMNLTSNQGEDSTLYRTSSDEDYLSNPDSSSLDSDVSIGSTGALSSSNLSLSNTLNIILIVLGILLVLLAIAILIRIR